MDWDTCLDLYLTDHQARGRSPKTIAWHRAILPGFVAWCRDTGIPGPDALRPAHLSAWLVWLRARTNMHGRKNRDSGVASTAVSVRAFLKYLHAQELMDRDLGAKLKVARPAQLPDPFTPDDVRKLWAYVAKLPGAAGVRDRALLAFLIDTGCRAGEVAGLDLDAVRWPERMAGVDGKTGPRMIAFGPKTAVLVRRYAAHRDPAVGALFQTSRGTRWTPNGLFQWARRLGERAGVPDCHPHRFRATCATIMAETGDLFAVQTQLGHTTLDMTRRYARTTQARLKAVHDQVSPLLRLTGGR